MNHVVNIGHTLVGSGSPLVLISGPCVIEDYGLIYDIGLFLKKLARRLEIPFIFKASYDKANRTSFDAFRGPGIKAGLALLEKLKADLDIPVLSDVHTVEEVDAATEVLDIIQIPALLCRQTDLLAAVARTNKPVNIKKGQFLAPWDMANVVDKVAAEGNHRILLTERGTTFGYNNLVVDFRGIQAMQETGYPVIFDATHSIQLPGGEGKSSGGQRQYAATLARAAVAAGADGIFLEVHKDPDNALCDGPNSLKLDALEGLLTQLKAIHGVVRNAEAGERQQSGG